MKLYSMGDEVERRELSVSHGYLIISRLRPAVGGGWYVKELLSIALPWYKR